MFDYNELERELIRSSNEEYDRLVSIVGNCPKDCEHCDANVICEEPYKKEATND